MTQLERPGTPSAPDPAGSPQRPLAEDLAPTGARDPEAEDVAGKDVETEGPHAEEGLRAEAPEAEDVRAEDTEAAAAEAEDAMPHAPAAGDPGASPTRTEGHAAEEAATVDATGEHAAAVSSPDETRAEQHTPPEHSTDETEAGETEAGEDEADETEAAEDDAPEAGGGGDRPEAGGAGDRVEAEGADGRVEEGAAVRPAEAFDALYVRHAAELTRQATLLTGRPTRARRAVRYAFRRAWQHWPEVARDPDPGGWVRAAAHEAALAPWRLPRSGPHRSRVRRRHATATAPRPEAAPPPHDGETPVSHPGAVSAAVAPAAAAAPAAPAPSTATALPASAAPSAPATGSAPVVPAVRAQQRLLEALLRLPPSYRRTLVLHDGLGLGLSATAAETEASTTATAGRLTRARGALAVGLPELGLARLTSPERGAALHTALTEAGAALPASPPPARHARRAGEYRARLLVPGVLAVAALFSATAVWAGSTAPHRAVSGLTTALAASPDPASRGPLPEAGAPRPGEGAPASTATPSSSGGSASSSPTDPAVSADGSPSPATGGAGHGRPSAVDADTRPGRHKDRTGHGDEGRDEDGDDGADGADGGDSSEDGYREHGRPGDADGDGRYAADPGTADAAGGTGHAARKGRHGSRERGSGGWGSSASEGAATSGRHRRHRGAGGATATPRSGYGHASTGRQPQHHRHHPGHSPTGGHGAARDSGSTGRTHLPAATSPGYGDSDDAPATDTGTGTGMFDDGGRP